MDVGMVRIAVDCGERNGLGKCLLQELIGQFSNLLVGGWDIKREDDAVVSPAAFPSLVPFKRAEVIPDVLNLLFDG